MPKNIIFCADGTWDHGDDLNNLDHLSAPTNVFKLFVNLEGKDDPLSICVADEQERSIIEAGVTTQIAKYIHGVGDSRNPINKYLGGVFGAGIISRIVRGYTFISRNYNEGDRIFIVGFSRGAYTARALAALISDMGLLVPRNYDKEYAYQLGIATWFMWRRSKFHNDSFADKIVDVFHSVKGWIIDELKPDHIQAVDVEAVCVWDTVGSLGIPLLHLVGGQLARLDVFKFADNKLPERVHHGFHAVAVDEKRTDYTPTLWDDDPRVVQTLWPGGHGNVGGGYLWDTEDSHVSNESLLWMTDNVERLGVKFAKPLQFCDPHSPVAWVHDESRRGVYKVLPKSPRVLHGISRSDCLNDRMAAEAVKPDPTLPAEKYAPTNI